ncbi:MAG: pirin family protein [Methylococcaceae bacterium]
MNKQTRQLGHITSAHNTLDGAGVKLKRCLSPQQKNLFEPFILLDEFASDEAADYIGGFPEHPHRGFETVTYMLEGSMLHRDHLGNEGHLRAGSVQWMSAAHGIIHSEMPEQENGLLHGFQLWINLPAKEKMKPPHYQEFAATEIPQVALADGGYIKIIAGDYSADGKTTAGAIKGVTTEPLYFDILLSAKQQLDVPINAEHTALIYVYDGELYIDTPSSRLKKGQLGQLLDGNNIKLSTESRPARFLLLAAKPLKEPIVQSGPFVMNTQEEIEQAFRDYRDGVLTL